MISDRNTLKKWFSRGKKPLEEQFAALIDAFWHKNDDPPIAGGSKILQGTTAPSNSVGIVGDWFINTALWDVYEKTGTTIWTLRGNIKGAAGIPGTNGREVELGTNSGYLSWRYVGDANWINIILLSSIGGGNGGGVPGPAGADGSKILQGTTAPSNSVGAIGDWFINTALWDIYEKTGTTIWTLRGNIKGAAGIPGTNGREVQLGTNSEYLAWRYVGDANWINIILLSSIGGGSSGGGGIDEDTGEWSPGGVSNALECSWHRIGSHCFIKGVFEIESDGDLLIDGLPFAPYGIWFGTMMFNSGKIIMCAILDGYIVATVPKFESGGVFLTGNYEIEP